MINIIANDNSIIPYRKELNKITGCVTASILLSQLLYWCKKSGGEFYKFKEPCKHEKYKEGDSWCEELGFTRKQFDTAFMKLETAGFAMKNTTMDRVTYYSVDECTLGKALNSLYVKPESHFTKSTKGTLDIYTETTPKTTPESKKDIRHKHGEYENVLLTDKQLEGLKKDFNNWESLIKDLDEGIELKGYKYKNHNLAIRKWAKNTKTSTKIVPEEGKYKW